MWCLCFGAGLFAMGLRGRAAHKKNSDSDQSKRATRSLAIGPVLCGIGTVLLLLAGSSSTQ